MTDKPLDAYTCAHNLRRWAKALKIPSGDFVNEDLEQAAVLLDNYADHLKQFYSPQETVARPHQPGEAK
jgi:hypothetical protein